MLKWAVNQPRNSYLALGMGMGTELEVRSSLESKAAVTAASYSEFHALRGKLKRKSLCVGKENQLTSTPLPAASSLAPRTPLLKDLSNILATPPSAKVTGGAAGAGAQVGGGAVAPPKYACTLPTFEAEYSPTAAVIPGPLIALRGMGVPDSYFEKPRYLEQKPLPHPHPHPHPAPLQQEQQQQQHQQQQGSTTLSSSQMGDVTLERMIDAILESNRKAPSSKARPPRQRQPRQHLRQQLQQQQLLRVTSGSVPIPSSTHSPTYRPAFDPASDLCEYWKSPSRRDSLPADGFEEREVRSPQASATSAASQSQSQSQCKSKSKTLQLQLRRQRVVRRKRKIATKISSSVRQSAQKLLAAARAGTGRDGTGLPGRRSAQKRRHISPDSGHNSTSDFEEELVAMGSSCCAPGLSEAATKRRLSFSFPEDLFVEK